MQKRRRNEVFPTPASPMIRTLKECSCLGRALRRMRRKKEGRRELRELETLEVVGRRAYFSELVAGL